MCKPKAPQGVTILEVVVSAVLVAALFSITLEMLTALANQRRASEQRVWAIESVANLMETFSAQPWDSITPAAAAELDLPPGARDVLTAAELDMEVTQEQDSPPARRITISLQWQTRGGQPAAPVRLTAWVFQPVEREP